MNAVDAANKAEIAMMHAVLANKFGQLYADIWKVGVNLSLLTISVQKLPLSASVFTLSTTNKY